jgi:hypothetical protein
MTDTSRRRTIACAGMLAGSGLAGCASSPGEGTETATDPATAAETATATATATATDAPTTRGIVAGEGPLSLRNVKFAATEPTAYREVDTVPTAEFQAGSEVYIYLEPNGVARRGVSDSSVEYSLTIETRLVGPDGTQLTTFTDDLADTVARDEDFSRFFAWQGFRIPEDADGGEYRATVTVVDDIDGAEASRTLTFTVIPLETETATATEPTDEYLQSFRDQLSTDDVTAIVEHLERTDDDEVNLTVSTTADVDSEEWNYDVGYIAGAFAVEVGEGWDAQRLVTWIESPGDRTHRFSVEHDDALAYANGEMSADEFVSRVMDTLEEV